MSSFDKYALFVVLTDAILQRTSTISPFQHKDAKILLLYHETVWNIFETLTFALLVLEVGLDKKLINQWQNWIISHSYSDEQLLLLYVPFLVDPCNIPLRPRVKCILVWI